MRRWQEEKRSEAVAGGAVGFEKILVLLRLRYLNICTRYNIEAIHTRSVCPHPPRPLTGGGEAWVAA